MPKKTRKEKELADQHKRALSSLTFTYEAKTSPLAVTANKTTSASFVRQDLLKTLILAGLFITAEIVLAQIIK